MVDDERLCAMEPRLRCKRFLLSAGLGPTQGRIYVGRCSSLEVVVDGRGASCFDYGSEIVEGGGCVNLHRV